MSFLVPNWSDCYQMGKNGDFFLFHISVHFGLMRQTILKYDLKKYQVCLVRCANLPTLTLMSTIANLNVAQLSFTVYSTISLKPVFIQVQCEVTYIFNLPFRADRTHTVGCFVTLGNHLPFGEMSSLIKNPNLLWH